MNDLEKLTYKLYSALFNGPVGYAQIGDQNYKILDYTLHITDEEWEIIKQIELKEEAE